MSTVESSRTLTPARHFGAKHRLGGPLGHHPQGRDRGLRRDRRPPAPHPCRGQRQPEGRPRSCGRDPYQGRGGSRAAAAPAAWVLCPRHPVEPAGRVARAIRCSEGLDAQRGFSRGRVTPTLDRTHEKGFRDGVLERDRRCRRRMGGGLVWFARFGVARRALTGGSAGARARGP